MRELKFRVWNIADKCWDSPAILEVWDDEGALEPFEYIKSGTLNPVYIPKENYIIQQYTGMKDEDGTEIYEGDIVSMETHNRLVRWSKSGGCWEIAPVGELGKKYAVGFNIDDAEEDYIDFNGFDDGALAFNGGNGYNGPIKILGNMFENPELLK